MTPELKNAVRTARELDGVVIDRRDDVCLFEFNTRYDARLFFRRLNKSSDRIFIEESMRNVGGKWRLALKTPKPWPSAELQLEARGPGAWFRDSVLAKKAYEAVVTGSASERQKEIVRNLNPVADKMLAGSVAQAGLPTPKTFINPFSPERAVGATGAATAATGLAIPVWGWFAGAAALALGVKAAFAGKAMSAGVASGMRKEPIERAANSASAKRHPLLFAIGRNVGSSGVKGRIAKTRLFMSLLLNPPESVRQEAAALNPAKAQAEANRLSKARANVREAAKSAAKPMPRKRGRPRKNPV